MSTLNDYSITVSTHWVTVTHGVCGRVVVTATRASAQELVTFCDGHTSTCPGPPPGRRSGVATTAPTTAAGVLPPVVEFATKEVAR